MKKWVFLGLLWTTPTIAADMPVPSFKNGNQLNEICGNPEGNVPCTAYIAGAIDAINGMAVSAGGHPLCTPDTVTTIQAADVVRKWLKDHPEKRHYVAFSAVLSAISDAFPCPPK